VPIDVNCPECSGRIRVPDKYAGKRVKCPKCQGGIAVPGGQTPRAPAPSQPAVAKRAASRAVPEEQWHVQTDDGEQYGPISKRELDQWVVDNRVDAGCQVLRDGWPQWKWAEEVYPQLAEPAAEPEPEPELGPIINAGQPTTPPDDNPFAGIGQTATAVGGQVNSFASPQTISQPPGLPATGGATAIPSGVTRELAKTNPSLMTAGIAGLVGSGLGLTISIIELVRAIKVMNRISDAQSSLAKFGASASSALSDVKGYLVVIIITALVGILASLFYAACSGMLINNSLRMGHFLRNKQEHALTRVLAAQTSFWKMVGIGTAAIVGVFLILFIIELATEPSTGMF